MTKNYTLLASVLLLLFLNAPHLGDMVFYHGHIGVITSIENFTPVPGGPEAVVITVFFRSQNIFIPFFPNALHRTFSRFWVADYRFRGY